MPNSPRLSGLSRWERIGLGAFFFVLLSLSALALMRSALLQRRMGDWNVFTRAAWAVREGGDLYDVTDDNGFHYLYPPLFAILLTPLADAPAGADRSWMLPYPATVAIWYALNLAFAALAIHLLADALQRTSLPSVSPDERDRRWWRLRIWPVMACLPAVGHTLVRGQVGLLLLLLLCGMLAALLRGRSGQAGVWLAAAICLKVIPAFLLIYPVWRRDVRFVAGCAAGLTLGLVVVPAAVRGPQQTWEDYRKWNQVLLLPASGAGSDQSRARELIDVTGTDSQSILAAIHNTVYLDRATRPRRSPEWIRYFAASLVGILIVATLAVARGTRRDDGIAAVLTEGCLILVMLAASPVCHLHYFCLAAPLVMGLVAANWEHATGADLPGRLVAVFAANVICMAIPHFPGMEVLRDMGAATYGSMALWLAGCFALGGRRPQRFASRRRCRDGVSKLAV